MLAACVSSTRIMCFVKWKDVESLTEVNCCLRATRHDNLTQYDDDGNGNEYALIRFNANDPYVLIFSSFPFLLKCI